MKKILLMTLCGHLLMSCGSKNEKLPILGNKIVEPRTENGRVTSDTIYHTIPDFSLVDQDSSIITQDILNGKIAVADFFFTSCPTICPVMKVQMLRVYEKYQGHPEVVLISHSIDPEFDTVAVLKDFAERLDVKSSTWHFLTGKKEEIYELGEKGYIVTAREEASAPGGFMHSGAFVLIDKEKRIRGLYDGTQKDQVDKLMLDMDRLLKEYAKN